MLKFVFCVFVCFSAWCVESEDACVPVPTLVVDPSDSCSQEDLAAPSWDLTRFYASPEDAQNDSWYDVTKTLFSLCCRADQVKADTPPEKVLAVLIEFRRACAKISCLMQYAFLSDTQGTLCEVSDELAEFLTSGRDCWYCLKRQFRASVARWDEEVVRAALRVPGCEGDGVFLMLLRQEKEHMLSAEAEYDWLMREGFSGVVLGESEALKALEGLRIECAGKTVSVFGAEVLAESANERERTEAVEGVIAAFAKIETRCLTCFNTIVKANVRFCQTRHYESPDAQRHLLNDLNAEWVDELRRSVQSSYGKTSHALAEIRAQVLGEKGVLSYRDVFAPLVPRKNTTWREGYDLICGAYEELDPSLGAYARALLDQGRLRLTVDDFELCDSCTCTPEGPYVANRYYGGVDGFVSLAHECGHAVHDLSSDWLPEAFGNAIEGNMFFCEVAALFSERLCVDYAMRHFPKQEGGAFFVGGVERFVLSVQGSISEDNFEKSMYALGASRDLCLQDVHDAWIKACRALYGDVVEFTDDVGVMWLSYTQLFSKPFYAYSYAMAGLFARVLFEQKDQPEFAEKYKTFLKKRYELRFSDVRKLFGITDDPVEFFRDALALVAQDIEAVRCIVRNIN